MHPVKKQHYVPRFYLSGFTSENNDQLYVLDKENNNCFKKNIKEVCEQNYFYSFYVEELEEYYFMLEEHLGKKESEFSFVFRELIDNIECYYYKRNGKFNRLSNNKKKLIYEFIIYQIIRVPKFVDKLFSIVVSEFKKSNKENGIEQSDKEIINDIKKYTFPNLFNKAEEVIPILSRKKWTFYIISEKINMSFISSDNPILITNSDIKSQTRGALIDPMTEISFPISKNIALVYCNIQT